MRRESVRFESPADGVETGWLSLFIVNYMFVGLVVGFHMHESTVMEINILVRNCPQVWRQMPSRATPAFSQCPSPRNNIRCLPPRLANVQL